ncbi:MAG: polyhydroxybutyrate depolymerase [Pseudomonadota bacterium]
MRRLLLMLSVLLGAPALADPAACGGEVACEIDGGSYHLLLPDAWLGGPAVIHLHGLGGSGARGTKNTGLVETVTGRGYALILPSGEPWLELASQPTDWAVRDGTTGRRDDIAFLRAVLDDAAARAGIDRGRVLMTGFSRGGSMVWDVACHAPGTAAAYAPAAGGFWKPLPESCTGPVRMQHSHGFTDGVVPLEGRRIPIETPVITQGDIFAGLQIWRRTMGCGSKADGHEIDGPLWRKRWTKCAAGGSLELILHAGGHGPAPGWMATAIDWFEGAPKG